MANIVLAHGILGFGTLPLGFESRYFNGIAGLYRGMGHEVLVPTVDLLGCLDHRSEQLRKAIQDAWPDRADIIVIGHSMGGLDIRRAVARSATLAQQVRTIITAATPHLGSPVANAVLNPAHPLRPHIPAWLLLALGPQGGAIADLQVRPQPHDPDVAGIKYVEIGCDSGPLPSTSPLFALTQALSGLSPGGNDGVVPLSSAKAPNRPLAQTWIADHGGAIGWPSGNLGLQTLGAVFLPPAEHLNRYTQLVTLA